MRIHTVDCLLLLPGSRCNRCCCQPPPPPPPPLPPLPPPPLLLLLPLPLLLQQDCPAAGPYAFVNRIATAPQPIDSSRQRRTSRRRARRSSSPAAVAAASVVAAAAAAATAFYDQRVARVPRTTLLKKTDLNNNKSSSTSLELSSVRTQSSHSYSSLGVPFFCLTFSNIFVRCRGWRLKFFSSCLLGVTVYFS